jgi:hypothetical protein
MVCITADRGTLAWAAAAQVHTTRSLCRLLPLEVMAGVKLCLLDSHGDRILRGRLVLRQGGVSIIVRLVGNLMFSLALRLLLNRVFLFIYFSLDFYPISFCFLFYL